MKQNSIIWVDQAKNMFLLNRMAADGTVLFRKKLSPKRSHLYEFAFVAPEIISYFPRSGQFSKTRTRIFRRSRRTSFATYRARSRIWPAGSMPLKKD
jgi:hypothetical protein